MIEFYCECCGAKGYLSSSFDDCDVTCIACKRVARVRRVQRPVAGLPSEVEEGTANPVAPNLYERLGKGKPQGRAETAKHPSADEEARRRVERENWKGEFYFVPLGRERGGLLDFLGLPPDANDEVVNMAKAEYALQLKNKVRQERGRLLEQKKAKEITEEEYQAKQQELGARQSKEETDFNELNEKFEVLRSERRKHEREGIKETGAVWADAYQSFGKSRAEFWQILIEPRPLPQMTAEVLSALHSRWVEGGDDAVVEEGKQDDGIPDVLADLPYLDDSEVEHREKWYTELLRRQVEQSRRESKASGPAPESGRVSPTWETMLERTKQAFARCRELRASTNPPQVAGLAARAGLERLSQYRFFHVEKAADVSLVRGLVNDQAMIGLLWADALWSELRGTNRGYWARQVSGWAEQIARQGPRLVLRPKDAGGAADDVQFPLLCRPVDGCIDRLEESELGDLAGEPVRNLADPQLAAMLRALLEAERAEAEKAEGDATPDGAGKPGAGKTKSMLEKLLEWAELLGSGGEGQ
jgi:hypothetical protein